MDSFPEIYFPTREQWRAWLSENHDQSNGLWLLFYKKDSGKPSLNYEETLEEALCFGWIDGIIKNLDSQRFVRKFTPRTNLILWSPSNRQRVERLMESGLMTEIGLSKIGDYSKTGNLIWPENSKEPPPLIPLSSEMIDLLKQNPVAFSNFSNLSASNQKKYVLWIMSAKQQETREKRMREAILLLEKNHKNLLK